MITNILLFIAFVVYNEAHIDFTDDLDYAGVSGMFVPTNANLNYEASDELSARQFSSQRIDDSGSFLNKIIDDADLFDKIDKAYNTYKKRKFEMKLYDKCVVDISFTNPNYFIKAEDSKCSSGIDLGRVIKKIFKSINIDTLSSDFIQSDIFFIKLLSISKRDVSIDATYKGLSHYTHTQSMIKLKNVNLQLKIPRDAANKISFLLKGELNNLKTEIVCNLAESPIAKVTVTVKKTTIKGFFESWDLKSTDFVNSAFPFEQVKNSLISGDVKALYHTKDNHFQLLAQLQYNDNVMDLTINVIIDKSNRNNVAVALVATLGSVENVMDNFLKKFNYNGPDFIKQLIKSGTLSISKQKINLIEHKDFLKLDGKVQKSVEEGINIYIETQIKESLSKCANKKSSGPSRLVQEKLYFNISNGQSKINLNSGNNDSIHSNSNSFIRNLRQTQIYQDRNRSNQQGTSWRPLNSSQQPSPNVIKTERNKANQQHQSSQQKTHPSSQNSHQQTSQNIIKIETAEYENLVKISFVSRVVLIKLPKTFSENINILMRCLFNEIKINSEKIIRDLLGKIPGYINKINANIHISELSFSYEEFKITMQYTKEIKAPFDLIIKSSTFQVQFKKKNNALTFTGYADIYFNWERIVHGKMFFTIDTLSNIAFDIRISITDISQFSRKIVDSKSLNTYISKFQSIALKNIFMSGNLNLNNMKGQLILSASTIIHNMDATITVFIWNSKKLEIAIGLIIKGGLSEALEKFASVQKTDSWFSDANIVMLLSNADKDSKPAEVKQLNGQANLNVINELRNKIDGGFLVEASFEFKENGNWKRNPVLNFLGEHGVKKILLKGKIGTSFNIEARIETDIVLHKGSGFSLTDILLVMKIESEKKEVFLKFFFKIPEPSITMIGSIGISQSAGLELSASMKDIVHNPFGWSWLSFGRLHASFLLKTLSFKLGAEVWFGNIPSSKNNLAETANQGLFKFKGFLGFSFASELQWFLSFERTGDDLTINTILKAFSYRLNLPEFIGNTGFIGDTKVSISLLDQEIRDFDVTVPHGVYMKGCLSIFNYRVAFEISVSLQKFNFDVKGWFDPITLGGIKMYRSRENSALGPVLKVQASFQTLDVYIEAYVSIFGMESEVKIMISRNKLYFNLHNNLFGVLKTNIHVEAEYNNGLKNFQISGSAESEVLDEMSNYITNKFKDAKRKAATLYKNAINLFNKIGTLAITGIIEFLRKSKERLQQKLEYLRAEEKKVNTQRTTNEENYRNCLISCKANEQKMSKLECDFLEFNFKGCIEKLSLFVSEKACIVSCKGTDFINDISTEFSATTIKVLKTLPSTAIAFLNGVESLLNTITKMSEWSMKWKIKAESIKKDLNKQGLDSCKVTHISVKSQVTSKDLDLMVFEVKCGNMEKREFIEKGVFLANDVISHFGSNYAKSIEPGVETLKNYQAIFIDSKLRVDDDFDLVKNQVSKLNTEVGSIFGFDFLPKINLFQRSSFFPMEYLNNASKVESYFSNPQLFPIEESILCQQHENVLSRYSTLATAFSLAINRESYIDESKISSFNQIDRLNDSDHFPYINSGIKKPLSYNQKIKLVRQVIDDAIQNERGMKLPEYIRYLDSIPVRAYENSQMNKKQYTNSTLHHIQEILLNVATNENIPTIELAESIDKVQQLLSDIERSSIPCAA